MRKTFKETIFLFGFILLLTSNLFSQQNQNEGKTEWENGILFWKSADGDFNGRFDIRMFLNGAYFFEGKNEFSNGTHLRKARMAVKMQLWKDWRAEWDIDVAEGTVEFKDMFFAYHGFENSHIKFGHFKIPYGLEILTTSRNIIFPERALVSNAFDVERRMSLEYSKWGKNWNVRTALFGQTFDINKNKTADETGGGLALRFVTAPIQTEKMILHLGASSVWERPSDNQWAVSYATEPETKIGDVEVLDTDNIFDVSNTMRYATEFAFVYDALHLQTEYQILQVNRFNELEQVNFNGGYALLTYTITGESRKWDNLQGEFSQLIPKNFKNGAWELAARFSNLMLSDTEVGILGGNSNNYTFGINWYPNPNMVTQLNYTMVETSENSAIGKDEFSFIQLMAKVFF